MKLFLFQEVEMRKFALLAAGLLVTALTMPRWSRPLQAEAKSPAPAIKVGDLAPDFKLGYFTGTDLKEISLHDYRGKKNVLLGFYIFAFTGG
jgi:hypothetical protein